MSPDEDVDEGTPLVARVGNAGVRRRKGASGEANSCCSPSILAAVAAVACAAALGYAARGARPADGSCLGPSGAPFECTGGPLDCAAASAALAPVNLGSLGTSGELWRPIRRRRFHGGLPQLAPRRPARARAPAESECVHWAVITTIFPPTRLVRQLAALDDWCVVVVGDLKALSEREYHRALNLSLNDARRFTYLDADAQRRLPYRIVAKLPWNHFGRKNLGFLHALERGATLVYDADDDNELRDRALLPAWARLWAEGEGEVSERAAAREPRAPPRARTVRELGTCAPIVNPYVPFRARWGEHGGGDDGDGGVSRARARGGACKTRAQFTWPRGFPLDRLRACETLGPPADALGGANGTAVGARVVGVLQSLADHDPDVDAIYRLTSHLPLQFARGAAPLGPSSLFALPAGTMAPFNAQATLWARPALWGLLLPITVHGRVSDIWRGYVVQRLLWLVGQRLAFAEPWVVQLRNPHSHLADLQSEQPLYARAGALVRWLRAWRPSERAAREGPDGLVHALLEISVALYEVGVLELADVELQAAWLADLRDARYEFPPLVPEPPQPRPAPSAEPVTTPPANAP